MRWTGLKIWQKSPEKLWVLVKVWKHLIRPILVLFPFVETHSRVDKHAIFCYEPMHSLFSGVSRMLKEYLWNMLSNDNKLRDAAGFGSRSCKSVKWTIVTVLSTVKQILADSQKLRMFLIDLVKFTKPGLTSRLNALFTESGLAEVL